MWQPLPEGWREAFDPVTNQPYYYHPVTHEKTWARPQQGRPPAPADTVTATPVVPMQQPRSLQPGRRRGGGGPGQAGSRGDGAASCASGAEPSSSAPLERRGSGAGVPPAGPAAAGSPPGGAPGAVAAGIAAGAALSDTL